MAKFKEGLVIQHKDGSVPYRIVRIRNKYKKGSQYQIYRLEPLHDGLPSFSVKRATIDKNYIIAKTYSVLYGK